MGLFLDSPAVAGRASPTAEGGDRAVLTAPDGNQFWVAAKEEKGKGGGRLLCNTFFFNFFFSTFFSTIFFLPLFLGFSQLRICRPPPLSFDPGFMDDGECAL